MILGRSRWSPEAWCPQRGGFDPPSPFYVSVRLEYWLARRLWKLWVWTTGRKTHPPLPSSSPVFAKKYCKWAMLPNAITLSLERAEFENSVPSGLVKPLLFISPLGDRPYDNRFDRVEDVEAIEVVLSRLEFLGIMSGGGVIGGDCMWRAGGCFGMLPGEGLAGGGGDDAGVVADILIYTFRESSILLVQSKK